MRTHSFPPEKPLIKESICRIKSEQGSPSFLPVYVGHCFLTKMNRAWQTSVPRSIGGVQEVQIENPVKQNGTFQN